MRAIAPPMRTPIPLAQHRCPRRKGVAPDDVLKKRFSLEVLLKSPYYWIISTKKPLIESGDDWGYIIPTPSSIRGSLDTAFSNILFVISISYHTTKKDASVIESNRPVARSFPLG